MTNIVYLTSSKKNLLSLTTLDALTPIIGFKFGSLALHFAGYTSVQDVANQPPENILLIPHIGMKKLHLVRAYLTAFGVDAEIHRDFKSKSPQLNFRFSG